MKIISLVENTTEKDLKVKPALSLYIETGEHKILFDVGQDSKIFYNAEKLGIDLKAVDTVIISHGHKDHGGALPAFLKVNEKAEIYIQKKALEPHYTKVGFMTVPVGISPKLKDNPRVKLLEGNYKIDDSLYLFTVKDVSECRSSANDAILDKNGRDTFGHEQDLIISEGDKNYLIMGCGHAGVVNIMRDAEKYKPLICVGGFHLTNPINGKPVEKELLDKIAEAIKSYKDTKFYTCHCTGLKAYRYLADKAPNLDYLPCGGEIET